MYLRVKRDSVTSILLFIFNVFLTERGINSVPLKKIFKLLEPFNKSETSIRMGLSRGVQNGLFINERQGQEVCYRLTSKAVKSFDYWRNTLARFQRRIQKQFAPWNGKWNIVLVNSLSRKRSAGDVEQFAEELKQLGYGILNKDKWLSPYDLSDEVVKLAGKCNLKKDLLLFQGEMKNRKPAAIVSEVWPIRKLANRYKKFEDHLQEATGKLDGPGDILTFLYFYGSELFEIIQDDPQLPVELLPAQWPGPQAAGSFRDIRERVLPEAESYITRILYK